MTGVLGLSFFDTKPLSLQSPLGDIKALHKLFNQENFKCFNSQELAMYFKDKIVCLDLTDDYITAYFAIKANPQAASLFSREIQEKYHSRASIFEDLKDDDQSTITLTPARSLSPSSDMSSVSGFSVEELEIPTMRFDEFVGQREPLVSIVKTEKLAERVLEKPTLDQSLIALQLACVKAKSVVMDMMIEEKFNDLERPIVKAMLVQPDPVLKVLLDNAKSTSDVHHKTWAETISLHIKSSPHFQNTVFETKAARLEMALLNRFSEEEQNAALNILSYPRATELVNSLTASTLSFKDKVKELYLTLKEDILKTALKEYLCQIYQQRSDFEDIMKKEPQATTKALITSYLKSPKQDRSTLRLLVGLDMIKQHEKKAPQRDPFVESMVKRARLDNNPKILDFLSASQKAQVTAEEMKEIREGFVLSQAQKALIENQERHLWELSKQEIESLPVDILEALRAKGFDLSGDEDL